MQRNGNVIVPGQVELDINWMEEPSIIGGHLVGFPGGKYVMIGGMSKRLAVAAQIFGAGDFNPSEALEAADVLIEEERRQRENG